MDITSLKGEQFLQSDTIAAIKKEVDLLLQNKDVAAAWRAARHIKAQLTALPTDKVNPILDEYRRLTSALKILALPLLDWEEVKTLVSKNFSFLEDKYIPVLAAALPAWLASLDDDAKEKARNELLKLLPPASPLRLSLATIAQSTPVAAPVPKAATISHHDLFNKDEAAELEHHAKKVNNIGGAPLAIQGGVGVAEIIFKEINAQEDQEIWLRRANALIASRLRDVRAKNDLREYLQRPFAVGGLGLAGDKLERASKLIEDEYAKLHTTTPAAKPPAPEPTAEPVAPVELPKVELPSVKPAPIILKPPKPAPLPKPEPVVAPIPRPIMPTRVAPINNKPRVDDIRPAVRTATSADELKFLTLADWRKYGSPSAAAETILKKINILDQAGALGRKRNVKLFQESELFKQYVAVGQASLTQGKKLAEALADKILNPAGLTVDEFFAITSLNSKLK